MRKTGGRDKAGGGRGEAGGGKRRAQVTGSAGTSLQRVAREKNRVLQPQQDLLAGGEIQQRHADRLLPRGREMAAAVSRESTRGADAVSRRHRRKIFLPEGRARLRP